MPERFSFAVFTFYVNCDINTLFFYSRRILFRLISNSAKKGKEEKMALARNGNTYGAIVRRINTIARIFDISPDTALDFVEKFLPETLPNGAEGWFAMPSLCTLAQRHFSGTRRINWSSWAANLVLFKLAESNSGFTNFCSRQIVKDRFCFDPRTEEFLRAVARKQPAEIWVVGAKFDGGSADTIAEFRKRMTGNEFGANTLAVGSILLTDPEYLLRYSWLSIPGDEFDPLASGSFDFAPHFFKIKKGEIGFGALPINEKLGNSVPVKLFLP